MEFKSHYWQESASKAAFQEFLHQIHGLDFTLWDTSGFWDERYTPFSFFEDGKVISSVCAYLLDAVVDGRTTKLTQISGVGTLSDRRREGWNRQLTEKALSWARERSDGIFLFADKEAIPYYEKGGFSTLEEFVEVVDAPSMQALSGARQLHPDNPQDLQRIWELVQVRTPASERFFLHSPQLLMFHILYVLSECIWEIPALDCLVLCSRKDGRLRIYDVIAENIPDFATLYPWIAAEDDSSVEFCFTTDKMHLNTSRKELLHGNHLMVFGTFPVAEPVFPFTSRA